ncbi:hypothetical protein L21SP4_02319 [Kiritimatiella glycovorans]|uniref:Uncharacterized protein n=1 Tax=Kiritimatiella glycovorans TaxID=1307763 RepID=A0A0G3ELA0_9BACT|nr:hypothetical protein L21SP4_02319 [Kiritimatiella glycovorans]
MSRGESRGNGPDGPRGSRGEVVSTALTGLVAIGGKSCQRPSRASWQSGDVPFPRAKRCPEARSAVAPSEAWKIVSTALTGLVAIGGKSCQRPSRASWQSGDVPLPRAKRCPEARSAVLTSAAFPRGAQRRCHVPPEAEGRFHERSVEDRVNGPDGPRGNRGRSWQSGGMSFPRAQRCFEAEGRFPRGAQRRCLERSVLTSAAFSRGAQRRCHVPPEAEGRCPERSVEDRVNGPDGPRGNRGRSWQSGGMSFPRAQRCFEAEGRFHERSVEDRVNGPDGPRGNRGRSWQSGGMSFPRAQRCFEAEGRFLRGAQRRFHERSVPTRRAAPLPRFPRGAQRRSPAPKN